MKIKRMMMDEQEKMGSQETMNTLYGNSQLRRFTDSPIHPFADSPVRKCAMGEGVVTREPHIISSSGLGSCVVVTIYDTKHKIGGLAHIMLPESLDLRFLNAERTECGMMNADCGTNRMQNADCGLRNEKNEQKNPKSPISTPKSALSTPKYMCADTAIAALLEELRSLGAVHIVAKMVGGAQMYSSYEESNPGIGKQNISSIKQILRRERIPLIGEDVGGHHGRNIEFYLDSGKVIVRAMGKGDKEI